MISSGPIASTPAMVTRFFCPKDSAEMGQLRNGYSPHTRRRVLHARARFRLAQAKRRQTQRHLVEDHGFGNHLVGVLHHVADMRRAFTDAVASDVAPLKQQRALIWRFKPADQLGQGGLAAPLRPTMASISPRRMVKLTSVSTRRSLVYPKPRPRASRSTASPVAAAPATVPQTMHEAAPYPPHPD